MCQGRRASRAIAERAVMSMRGDAPRHMWLQRVGTLREPAVTGVVTALTAPARGFC